MTNSNTLSRRKRHAKRAGLFYVNSFDRGITRHRHGRGFTYKTPTGRTLRSKRHLQRIESLVIPPAWDDVWICSKPTGHIQARGRDADNRQQYLYHEQWAAVRAELKFGHLQAFRDLLPKIRRRVRKDLTKKKLGRTKVVAAVIRLLDRGRVRVGNPRYASERGSRGATTLTESHVEIDETLISLDFPGKSGKSRQIEFRDSKLVNVLQQCSDLSGQFLFSYLDDRGECHRVDSTHVNDYLSDVAKSHLTAKDFRTWWAGVCALDVLASTDPASGKSYSNKQIIAAVDAAAEALGNTRTVCRNSYIHPGILRSAESGMLREMLNELDEDRHYPELTIAENQFALLLPQLDLS